MIRKVVEKSMIKNEVSIMDIPFVNATRSAFIEQKIRPMLESEEKCFIVTANPEIVMETRRNPEYKKIVQSANFVVPDGVGILLAAKRKKEPLLERIAGFDLMQDLLQLADENRAKCFFLGASEEVNKLVVEKIRHQFPNIKIAGRHHGYFDLGDLRVVEKVKDSDPDFVFVALGYPKQERWIHENLHHFTKGIFMGVGGSFDVIAGKVKRAPDIWIKWNLEWLYRIIQQPFRIKRILPVFKFLFLIYLKREHE